MIADGDDIWQDIADTAHKHVIDRHIPFNTYVRRRLPLRLARWIVRWRNAMFGSLGWLVARKAPEYSKRLAWGIAERNTGSRPHRAGAREAVGVHEFPRLHACLSAPGRRQDAEQPALNLKSGLVLRAPDVLPKSGTRRPWMLSHNFARDVIGRPFESIEQSMVFGRVRTEASQPA